ncbi:MAG: hypothetical protein KF878_00040 [Planctomycetes bacterium]|nr:hypothetical protein [Planctomycetota bacterium]
MAGTVVIGPGAESVTREESAALVYARPEWGGGWVLLEHAVFERASIFAGSDGVSSLEFSTPYGRHKPPLAAAFAVYQPAGLMGWWVRLDFVDPAGAVTTVFHGQVRGEDRQVLGSQSDTAGSTAPLQKGWQRWHAHGGQILLRLRAVSTSWWERGGETVELGWFPGFNRRDRRGFLIGNRSAAPVGGTCVFGGHDVWTRRQALDYVLARHLATADGLTWGLGGQLDALDQDLEDMGNLSASRTVEDLLRELIPRRTGLDFAVVPTFGADDEPSGFEVRVFALIGTNVTFRGATLPRNPDLVTIQGADMADVEAVHVVRDDTHRAARVRVVGARVVVCATLRGPELAGDPAGDVLTSPPATLRGQWTESEEAAYQAGAPGADGDDARAHDAYRRADRFRAVYQRFAAPAGWERGPGVAPALDALAQVLPGVTAPHQDAVRSTLTWTPLREGWDYSQDPPVDRNPPDAEPELLPPLVVAQDREAELDLGEARVYSPADHLGLGVSVLRSDLGIVLAAAPNHRLARGRWDGAPGASDFDPEDDEEPRAIDPRTLAATVAWRSDARLVLEAALAEGDDDGTVVELEVPDAELWWLAPGTVVDVDASGGLVTSGPLGRVLRNDADRLAGFMAGAIARHLHGRARATVAFRGWRPWVHLVGSVLRTVEEGGETHGIDAPITAVELYGGRGASPKTVIRAGYAL